MKIIHSILLPVSLFVCFSCKKEEKQTVIPVPDPEPVSCWTLSNRLVKNGEAVTFQNCSQNYDQILWNFGDGLIAVTPDASHTWFTNGIYDVSLTVYSKAKTNVYTEKVYVGKKADLNMTTKFTNWNIPAKYSRYQVAGSIFRSNDLINAVPETGPYFAYSENGPVNSPPATKNGTAVFPDASSNYRLKLWFYGFTNNGGYEKIDSLITDEINIWTSPKTPVGVANLGVVTANYTLSPVRIY